MLKNILNLKGAQQLSKKEQQNINGGGIPNCSLWMAACAPGTWCINTPQGPTCG